MNTTASTHTAQLPGEIPFALTQPDGARLRGCFRDSGSELVGIYVHGFRSDCNGEKALAFARHAHARGWSWLRFDMRGHGLSDGELGEQNISKGLADLLAVFEYTQGRPVLLMASSMGGWLSLLASLRDPARVRGMVLIAPAFNFVQERFATLPAHVLSAWRRDGSMSFPDDYGNELYSVAFSTLADAEQYDVLNRPVELGMPVHIVHGEKDAIVPLAIVNRFIDNVRANRLILDVVPGGDHRLTDHIPLIKRHLDRVWQEIPS
jgi:pimeloyl-ACP methyl ester carboxylesterase